MPYDLRSGEADHNRQVHPHPHNSGRLELPGQWGPCYYCEGCFEVDNSTKTEMCALYQHSLNACISFSGTNLLSPNGEPIVIRACANTLGYCETIRKKYSNVVEVKSCTECYYQGCNTIEY